MLYIATLTALIEDHKNNWLRAVFAQFRQVGWSVNYSDEIMADFLFLSGIQIDPFTGDYAEMTSRQFFALVKQLPGYEGAVRRRFMREMEVENRKRERKIAGMKLPNGAWNMKLLANRARARGGSGIEQGSKPIN